MAGADMTGRLEIEWDWEEGRGKKGEGLEGMGRRENKQENVHLLWL